MTLEELKDRKNEFLEKMKQFENFYRLLDRRTELLKELYPSSIDVFDNDAYKIFEYGIHSWFEEFFKDFIEIINTNEEISYFIYEMDWGKKSSINNKKCNLEHNGDVSWEGKEFYLKDIESFWDWIIWCIESAIKII